MREVIGMVCYLCNSNERVRNYKQKYVAQVQSENNRKFNYYTECVSRKNISIENKELKRFVAKSSRAPPGEVQDPQCETPDLQLQLKNRQKTMLFLPLLKMLTNKKIVRCVYMKKMFLFISFLMIYYMLYSDEWFTHSKKYFEPSRV